jgi:hypothetical protein
LDGNTDGWYTIIYRLIAGNTPSRIGLRPNNDTGTNYGRLGIAAADTTAGSDGATGETMFPSGYCSSSGRTSFGIYTFYAKSGAVRLANCVWTHSITGTTVTSLNTDGLVWDNTVDNVTSITFCSNAANDFAVGTRVIILKGNALAVGTSPGTTGAWKRVGNSVLGGAASSVTFSSLAGDTAVCYYLSSQFNASGGTTGSLLTTFNADSGNNYGFQQLKAENTTASAERTDPYTGMATGSAASDGNSGFFTHLIFAKKGFIRPTITNSIYTISGTTVTRIYTFGNSWKDTANEITSVKVAVGSNNFAAGSQFDLYALYT